MIDEPNDQEIPDDVPEWARELTPQQRRDPELPRPAQPVSTPQHESVPEPERLTGVAQQLRRTTELFKNVSPGPNLVAVGSMLRAEAEQFVVWCNQMGEPAGASWGSIQRTNAAHERKKLRVRAAELRFEIQAKIPNGLERTLDRIFGPECRGQYDELVTLQARQELGL